MPSTWCQARADPTRICTTQKKLAEERRREKLKRKAATILVEQEDANAQPPPPPLQSPTKDDSEKGSGASGQSRPAVDMLPENGGGGISAEQRQLIKKKAQDALTKRLQRQAERDSAAEAMPPPPPAVDPLQAVRGLKCSVCRRSLHLPHGKALYLCAGSTSGCYEWCYPWQAALPQLVVTLLGTEAFELKGTLDAVDLLDWSTCPVTPQSDGMYQLAEYDALLPWLKSHEGPANQKVPGCGWKLRVVPLRQEAVAQILRGVEGRRVVEIEDAWDRLEELAPKLHGALLPFQVEGVRTALEFGGRVLIGDDMGVGKTLQAIAIATCYRDRWPLLIIVPASLRYTWAEELEKWLPFIGPQEIQVVCPQD